MCLSLTLQFRENGNHAFCVCQKIDWLIWQWLGRPKKRGGGGFEATRKFVIRPRSKVGFGQKEATSYAVDSSAPSRFLPMSGGGSTFKEIEGSAARDFHLCVVIVKVFAQKKNPW